MHAEHGSRINSTVVSMDPNSSLLGLRAQLSFDLLAVAVVVVWESAVVAVRDGAVGSVVAGNAVE